MSSIRVIAAVTVIVALLGAARAGASQSGVLRPWREVRCRDWVAGLSFSHDGRLLAASVSDARSTGPPSVELYDTASWRRVRVLPYQWLGGFSPTSHLMVTISSREDEIRNGAVSVWDTRAWRVVDELPVRASSAQFSLDGRSIVTSRNIGKPNEARRMIETWDSQSFMRLSAREERDSPPTPEVWSFRRTTVEQVTYLTFRVRDRQSGRLLCTLRERAGVHSVAESPDGRWLATVGVEHAVRLWNPRTGRKCWLLEGPPEPGWALAFTPDGKLIAAGGHHSRVYLWRVPRR